MITYDNGKFFNTRCFTDGTKRMDSIACNLDVEDEVQIVWKYTGDSEIFDLICLVKDLRDTIIGCEISLFMPYLPYARMDRVEKNKDIFTLKYFAEVINSLNFDRVYVFDAHSDVSVALIDRCVNISPIDYITKYINECGLDYENDVLVLPDAGSFRRLGKLLKFKNVVVGMKSRDWESGKINSLELVGNIPEGSRVLFVDDICSKGDTACKVLSLAKRKGAGDCYCFFSHIERTFFDSKLITGGLVHSVAVTDSMQPSSGIESIKEVCKRFNVDFHAFKLGSYIGN